MGMIVLKWHYLTLKLKYFSPHQTLTRKLSWTSFFVTHLKNCHAPRAFKQGLQKLLLQGIIFILSTDVASVPNIPVKNSSDVKEDTFSIFRVDVHIDGLVVARK